MKDTFVIKYYKKLLR